jgi:Mn-dependent DtxR family transcriptional regulator
VAYGLILQHIMSLKDNNFQGQIVASEISKDLHIPYKTVTEVFSKLKDNQILTHTEIINS